MHTHIYGSNSRQSNHELLVDLSKEQPQVSGTLNLSKHTTAESKFICSWKQAIKTLRPPPIGRIRSCVNSTELCWPTISRENREDMRRMRAMRKKKTSKLLLKNKALNCIKNMSKTNSRENTEFSSVYYTANRREVTSQSTRFPVHKFYKAVGAVMSENVIPVLSFNLFAHCFF